MTYQHLDLLSGHWQELSFLVQMGNVGSEITRTIDWQNKPQFGHPQKAFARALELLWLTIDDPKNKPRLRELCRTYEALNDWFYGDNLFNTNSQFWYQHFMAFQIAARNNP